MVLFLNTRKSNICPYLHISAFYTVLLLGVKQSHTLRVTNGKWYDLAWEAGLCSYHRNSEHTGLYMNGFQNSPRRPLDRRKKSTCKTSASGFCLMRTRFVFYLSVTFQQLKLLNLRNACQGTSWRTGSCHHCRRVIALAEQNIYALRLALGSLSTKRWLQRESSTSVATLQR